MFLARVLEQETMGLYFIALMVVFLLKIVSDIGVDLAFVKQYPAENETGKQNLLRSAFAIRALSCTVVSILYLLVERSGKISFINDIAEVTALTLAMYWMHSFRELLLRLLQAEQLFTIYAGVQALAAILKALLVLLIVVIIGDGISINMVLMIEAFAFGASIFYAAVRIREKLLTAIKAKFIGGLGLLKFGYPLYLNALLNLGNEKVSQYIVAGFGGPITMALYGVAERLADAGARLFESFANVYYPSQTENFANNDKAKATDMAVQSLMWVSFVLACAIVGFTILREPVMTLVFSDKYLSAANAAAMFFGVLLLRSTQTLMGYFGVAAGLKFLPVRVSTFSSVFNIATCFIAFKMFGYQGAIATLLATQLLMNFLYHYWLGKAGFKINIRPVLIIGAACIASVTMTYLLGKHFFLTLFIFPAFVAVCLTALPGLRSDLFDFLGNTKTFIQNKSSGANTKKA